MSDEYINSDLIPPTDHQDSLLYMATRRIINEEYAIDPVDFNLEGLKAGSLVIGRRFTSSDLIADIGSSSGEMIASAAQQLEVEAKIICIEPDEELAHTYLPYRAKNPSIHFIRGVGESIPIKDNAVVGASLHNVIFRASNTEAMLNEVKRIVQPDGFIAISTNAEGHATNRHGLERQVGDMVIKISGRQLNLPEPPAAGHYVEDLPDIFRHVGGLEELDQYYVAQNTNAAITAGDRLETYLSSLKYSASNVEMPNELRTVWRKAAAEIVSQLIRKDLDLAAAQFAIDSKGSEPYYADPIKRGMFVLRNIK